MRVLVALALFALAAAVEVPKVFPDHLFEPLTEYLYEYRILTATSVPLKSHQATGLEAKGTLSLFVQGILPGQKGVTLVLQLLNITSALFDKEVVDLTAPLPSQYHRPRPELTLLLEKPVIVKIVNNKVVSLQGVEGVPETVLNLYRSIATTLTVTNPVKGVPFSKSALHPIHDEDEVVTYRVNEETLVGVCETQYQVHSSPTNLTALNLTKIINPSKCLGVSPTFKYAAYETQGCPRVCPSHKPENVSDFYLPEYTTYYDPYDAGCPESFHSHTDLAESFISVSYNISLKNPVVGTLEGIKAVDKKVMLLGRQQLVTTGILDLNLKYALHVSPDHEKLKTLVGLIQPTNLTYRYPTEHYVNSDKRIPIEYLSLYGPFDTKEVRSSVRSLVTRLADLVVADDLGVKGDSGEIVVQLVEAISVLQEPDLRILFRTVVPKDRVPEASDKDYVERKVLLDVLSLSGTDITAKFLLKLLSEKKLTILEATHILGALQGSLVHPDIDVLDSFLALLKLEHIKKERSIYSDVAITFAKLVSKNCVEHDIVGLKTPVLALEPYDIIVNATYPEGRPIKCTKHQYEKYVQAIVQELKLAKTYAYKVILIQALARLNHPKALEALVPYITGQEPSCGLVIGNENPSEACQFLRLATVYALHHSIKEHSLSIQPIVQDLYFNLTESYEIRAAAFTILLATEPTEATLTRVILELPHETNNQIASYVYSALLTAANSTIPCHLKTATRIQQLLHALTDPLVYGIQYSKYKLYTEYTLEHNFGIKLQTDCVKSNISVVPRSFYTGATFSRGPYVASLYDVSVLAKGVENLVSSVTEKGGPIVVLKEAIARVRRALMMGGPGLVPDLEALLNSINAKFTFNYDHVQEEYKKVISTSFLGADHVLPTDKPYLEELLLKAILHVKTYWKDPIVKRYTHVMLPFTYVKVSPAVSGLPVLQITRYPVIFSFAVKDVVVKPNKLEVVPDPFGISALVQPSFFLTAINTAYTITPLSKITTGVNVCERTKATFPVDLALQYSLTNQTFVLTVRPRFTKLVEHTTQTITFNAPAVVIGSRERPVVQQLTVIRPQLLPFEREQHLVSKDIGFGLHIQAYSEDHKIYIPTYLYPKNAKKGRLAGALELLQNPWVLSRALFVKSERHPECPVDEYKVALRWNSTLNPLVLTKKYPLVEGVPYPLSLQEVDYEVLYEEATGTAPPKYDHVKIFKNVAALTEPNWKPVNPLLAPLVKKAENTTHSYIVEYVIAALGPNEHRAIAGHFYHGSVFDKTLKLSQLNVTVTDSPFLVLLNTSVARTPLPSPYVVDVPEKSKQQLVAGLLGEFETTKIPKQTFSYKVVAEPSDEQLNGLLYPNGTVYKPWYFYQCEEDRKSGLDVVSYACEKVFKHYTNLNHIDFKVELPTIVPAPWVNLTQYALEYAKIKYYNNVHVNYTVKTEDKKILGTLTVTERVPEHLLVNVSLAVPDDRTLLFRSLNVPNGLELSLPYQYPEVVQAFLRKNYSAPTCLVGGGYLKTFNNVTIPIGNVSVVNDYILVRENSDEPDFTLVLAAVKNTSKVLKVILKNETLLILKPSLNNKTYSVLVNSTEYTVTPLQPHVIPYTPKYFSQILLHVTKHVDATPVLWLYVKDLSLLVAYDGVNVTVKVNKPCYYGRLSGLCGTANGEYTQDLIGPEGCLYEDVYDFISSYAFIPLLQKPKSNYTCPVGVVPRGVTSIKLNAHMRMRQMSRYSADDDDYSYGELEGLLVRTDECLTEKHVLRERPGKICISLDKVPACKRTCRAESTKKIDIALVCLPKKSPVAKAIVKDIQSEREVVLPRDLPPTFHTDVDVPESCVPK